MLLNLVSNAFKFTFSGGITVSASRVRDDGADFVEFVVEDTGIGIEEHNIGRLFKLFGMLSDTNNLNPNGTGIGLTISKKYVEKLGGTIRVHSTFGRGTKFVFTVPFQEGSLPYIEQHSNDDANILNTEMEIESSIE